MLYEIQESPHERGVIWAGANDGPIHVTRDAGQTWTDVTPPGLGPYGRVQTIEVSPHRPATAYAAILRYQVGDFAPYLFRTDDYGANWTRLTTGGNGIPDDHPVRVVREDPDRAGLLYAGTEFGMFISVDDGARWQPFQLNLPVTPLHQVSDQVATADAHLFGVRDAYRRPNVQLGSGPAAPQYPPVGAYVDYHLGDAVDEIRLEILDPGGQVIRRFSNTVPGQDDTLPTCCDWRLESAATVRLPSEAGAHRFVWDLRLPGPWSANVARSGRRGPMVRPGRYEARLVVGDWSATEAFQVRLDPRVAAEGLTSTDIRAQVDLALEARDALSEARLAVARMEQARVDGALGALRDIYDELVTASIRYSQPRVVDQLQYLYSNLIVADQRPGRDAELRYDDLRAALDEQMAALEQLLDTTR